VPEVIIFMRAKHIIGDLEGFFEEVQDNMGVKKVKAPSKNIEKSPTSQSMYY
jgi:hypothetical protein